MSGHSKWHQIRHKKGIADKKRGKIFTMHAKLITMAAQEGGGDMDTNPKLRGLVEKAKAGGVPNANIERAIKRGTGELAGGRMEAMVYEGYAPGGVALLVKAMTDNKNRAVQEIRLVLSRNGGSLGSSGSVAYLFKSAGMIMAKLSGKNAEEAEMMAIEAGAEDVSVSEDILAVTTAPTELMSVRDKLVGMGFEVESAELTELPQTTVKPENIEAVEKVVDALEEIEDVDEVFCNAELE